MKSGIATVLGAMRRYKNLLFMFFFLFHLAVKLRESSAMHRPSAVLYLRLFQDISGS